MSLNKSFIVFVCFGCVISQTLFRNFTFEIIDYFKCRSNGSSRPHLNQMLEFSLNRLTTITPHPKQYLDHFESLRAMIGCIHYDRKLI